MRKGDMPILDERIRTARRGLTERELDRFGANGFLVVRQLFLPHEIDELRDTFMSQAAHGPVPNLSEVNPKYQPDDPLTFYPRMMHPHRHPDLAVGPISMRLMLDERIGDILRDLFGEKPVAAQSMFYFKPPGARGQALHQDNYYLRVLPGTCMAAWTAVDDADEESGTLVVVPGSHRGDIVCPGRADSTDSFTGDYVAVPTGLQEQTVPLKAGDVLFFNGSLIHGSYANRSHNRFRRAFICHYVPAGSEEVSRWYRPLYQFDGAEAAIAEAVGGGPCGQPDTTSTLH